MNSRTNGATDRLPDEVQALFFVCDCFNLGEAERGNYRMKLNRARTGTDISAEERERIRQQIFTAVRKTIQIPVSHSMFVTDPLVTDLLELYTKIYPRLRISKIPKEKLLWIIVLHALVPTAWMIIRQGQRTGLGTEFRGRECWYLPQKDGTRVRMPVQMVLDRWLRTAGLRTDYRISKEIGGEAVRKKINGWLKGEHPPTIQDLFDLVDEFSTKVKWLDDPNSWKGRFRLACAAQHAWHRIDKIFKPICQSPSLELAQKIGDFAKEIILQDDNRVLTLPDTFFAACLLRSSLERNGKFKKIIAPAFKPKGGSIPGNVSDEEARKQRQQIIQRMEWESKPGNWFVEFVLKKAIQAGKIQPNANPLDVLSLIQQFLFDFGVQELNRLAGES